MDRRALSNLIISPTTAIVTVADVTKSGRSSAWSSAWLSALERTLKYKITLVVSCLVSNQMPAPN